MSKKNRRRFTWVLIALWIVLAIAAVANSSDVVTVTRKGKDVYKATDGRVFLTRYCYVYAYSERAVYDGSDLIFIDEGSTCSVKDVI